MKPITPKKDLQITAERIRISATPGVEAEAQQVNREYQTRVGAGPRHQAAVGSIPGVIQYGTTAGEMANAVKTACVACRHFDTKLWHQYLAAAEGPLAKAEDKQTMQAMRQRIFKAGYGFAAPVTPLNPEGIDIEATMRGHGICRVLSDWVEGALKAKDPMHWPVICWQEATCPKYVAAGPHRMDVTTPERPLGLFQPKDLDAKTIGTKRYDKVLFDAAGKTK